MDDRVLLSEKDDSALEDIDGILNDLEKRELEPSDHYSIAGVFVVGIIGAIIMAIASSILSWGLISFLQSEPGAVWEVVRNEKFVVFKLLLTLFAFLDPIYPIFFPIIFSLVLFGAASFIMSIVANMANVRNKKILLFVFFVHALFASILFDVSLFENISDRDWGFWAHIILVPFMSILIYPFLSSDSDNNNYCTVCGVELSMRTDAYISSEYKLTLIKIIKNNEKEQIGQIKPIIPEETDEPLTQIRSDDYLEMEIYSCPKKHQTESRIQVARVYKEKDENGELTTTRDFLFSTLVPFEIANEICTMWGMGIIEA